MNEPHHQFLDDDLIPLLQTDSETEGSNEEDIGSANVDESRPTGSCGSPLDRVDNGAADQLPSGASMMPVNPNIPEAMPPNQAVARANNMEDNEGALVVAPVPEAMPPDQAVARANNMEGNQQALADADGQEGENGAVIVHEVDEGDFRDDAPVDPDQVPANEIIDNDMMNQDAVGIYRGIHNGRYRAFINSLLTDVVRDRVASAEPFEVSFQDHHKMRCVPSRTREYINFVACTVPFPKPVFERPVQIPAFPVDDLGTADDFLNSRRTNVRNIASCVTMLDRLGNSGSIVFVEALYENTIVSGVPMALLLYAVGLRETFLVRLDQMDTQAMHLWERFQLLPNLFLFRHSNAIDDLYSFWLLIAPNSVALNLAKGETHGVYTNMNFLEAAGDVRYRRYYEPVKYIYRRYNESTANAAWNIMLSYFVWNQIVRHAEGEVPSLFANAVEIQIRQPCDTYWKQSYDEFVDANEVEVLPLPLELAQSRQNKVQTLLDYDYDLATRFSKRFYSFVSLEAFKLLLQTNDWDPSGSLRDNLVEEVLGLCRLNTARRNFVRQTLTLAETLPPLRCHMCTQEGHISIFCNRFDIRAVFRSMSPTIAPQAINFYLEIHGVNADDEDARTEAFQTLRVGQVYHACRFFNSRNGQGFAHLHGNHILSDMYLLKLLAPYLLITNIRWQPVGGRPVFLEGLQRVQEFSFDVCCENGVRALPPRIATPDGQVLVFGVNPP